MAPSRALHTPSRAAASPSSFVEEMARRQWDSLKKNKPGRSGSRDATPARPSPAQAAAELRQRLDETKRQRSRSRSQSRDRWDAGSENSDYNVHRDGATRVREAERGRSPPSTAKRGSSLILAAAERQWEGLHTGSRGRATGPQSEDARQQPSESKDGSHKFGDSAERNGKSTARSQSDIPQHIMALLVQVCGSRGPAQEQAAEKLRDIVHDRESAKLVAEEAWALEALARPLIDGSDRARVACAACFRHLALDGGGSTRMLQSPLILTGLVTALCHGADDTRQKAAAALGNLAWRSEASREVIMGAAGVMDGLLLLLRFGPPPGRESALAALSNLTLNQLCTTELVRAPEALSELVGEMLTGSAKGQLRATGIVRNMAAKPDNREALKAFPGMVPVLERLADACGHEETQQRAAKALKLIMPEADAPDNFRRPAIPSRGGQSLNGAVTVPSNSRACSPVVSASVSACSSPGRAQGRSASPDSDTGGNVDEGEVLRGARRALMTTRRDSASPITRLPVNSFSRRVSPRKGKDPERGAGEGGREFPGQGVSARRPTANGAIVGSVMYGIPSATQSEKPVLSSSSAMSSPTALQSGEEDAFTSPRQPRHAPVHSNVGSVLAKALGTSPVFGGVERQAGDAGREESEKEEAAAVELVLSWLLVHGWEGVQERLFDLGETDYESYSKIEPRMVEVSAAKGIYLLNGHQVHLIGTDRYNPSLVLDVESKQVIWDIEAHTKYTFPLARKYMVCKLDGSSVQVMLKANGKVVARGSPAEQPSRQSPHVSASKPLLSLGSDIPDSPAPVPQLSNTSTLSNTSPIPKPTRAMQGQEAMKRRSRSHLGINNAMADPPADAGGPQSSPVVQGGGVSSSAALPDPRPSEQESSAQTGHEDGMVEVKLSGKSNKNPSNPELWRALMQEGVLVDGVPNLFLFRGRRLTVPTYNSSGLATVSDALTGEPLYVGPGRHEVFPPTRVAAGVDVVKELMAWANVHGWHELSRRLFDQGTTDYSAYAVIDKEMKSAGAADTNLFVYRGRTLRLEGPSRWDPHKLLDAETGELLWDSKTATKLRFPWAREALDIDSDPHYVYVRERTSRKLLIKLELASSFDLVPPPAPNQDAPHAHPAPSAAAGGGPTGQTGASPRAPVHAPAHAPVAASEGDKENIVKAVLQLRDWAELKGWYDLDSRLFNAGSTDYREYGELERRLVPVHGRAGIYTLDGQSVEVVGHRLDPVKVTYVETKQLLWDAESHTTYDFPWARQYFALRILPSNAVQVVDKQTGEVVVQVGGTREPNARNDALVLQSILMDAQPVLQRSGLEPLLNNGAEIVQVLKDFSPSFNAAGAGDSTQEQLTVHAGDLLQVMHAGAKGWQLGKVIDLSHPTPLAGKGREGWFPATYAAPVQELATWHGRVIQIGAPEPDGVVTVTDTRSGNVIFWGHPEAPEEKWNMSHPHVSTALSALSPVADARGGDGGGGAGAGAGGGVGGGARDVTPRAARRGSHAGEDASPRNLGSPRGGVARTGSTWSPRRGTGISPLRLAVSVSPLVQARDMSGKVAAWVDNLERFHQCASSVVLLDGQFACKGGIVTGDGERAEETLEMRASGTFRYISWCKESMLIHPGSTSAGGRGAQWMVLGGVYRVSLKGGAGGAVLLLSIQTVAEAPTRPAALAAPVKVIQGVCVRANVFQEHGRFHSIEWAAGHSEAGMGACGAALKVVYVTAC